MSQFGAGFFLIGFTLIKLYKVVKKKVCGDDNDIDPETGKSRKIKAVVASIQIQCSSVDGQRSIIEFC